MRFLGKGLVYVFVIVMAALTLFPFLYMLSSSLMTYQEVTSIPPTIVPHVPQWHNFVEAMRQAPFPPLFPQHGTGVRVVDVGHDHHHRTCGLRLGEVAFPFQEGVDDGHDGVAHGAV